MENSKQFNRLRILFFIRYFGDAFFFSFLQLFLAFKGLGEAEIGFINSLRPLLVLFMNPFFALISKDVNQNRRIMKVITIVEGILIAFITKFNGLVLLTIFVSLISMIDSPFYSLLDGYTVSFTHVHNKKYSSFRVMGSLAYVFGNIFGGLAIDYLGYNNTFLISSLLMILTGIILMLIKPLKVNRNEEKEKISIKNYLTILKNPKFYIYILIYIGTITIAGIGDNFISLYFLDKGIDSKEYGVIASCIIVAEVLTMFLYSKISKKVSDNTLYVIIGLTYALRSVFIGLDCSLYLTIPASLLRGVAWGLALSIHVNYLRKIVGTQNITTAIFLLAIISSVVQMVGLNIAGNIIESQGYEIVYFGLTIIALITTLFIVIYNKVSKKININ